MRPFERHETSGAKRCKTELCSSPAVTTSPLLVGHVPDARDGQTIAENGTGSTDRGLGELRRGVEAGGVDRELIAYGLHANG